MRVDTRRRKPSDLEAPELSESFLMANAAAQQP
jgi:hypothetical protein